MKQRLIFRDLSYKLVGMLYATHNELGRFCKEKQYGDFLEELFIMNKINYLREWSDGARNRVDFIIEDKIVLELKAKPRLEYKDYIQTQRYLQMIDLKLGYLVNFRSNLLQPKRIVRIEKKK